MYSAPDFIKISVQQARAFASACEPEWEMHDSSVSVVPCEKITMNNSPVIYQCYFSQNAS